MATEHYLLITDGTETVTIADGAGGATDFKLQHETWAPQVAGLRASKLAGNGPYDDVVETMSLTVSGATVPAVLANVAKLARLLANAERWARHEQYDPVLIKYSPKGATTSSVANPLQAVVLGRAPGDQTSAVRLPVTLGDLSSSNRYLTDVQVRFFRRGLWLGADSSANPGVDVEIGVPITNGPMTAGIGSPQKVSVSGFNPSTTPTLTAGVFVSAQSCFKLEAESQTATGYTSVADSANKASGGSVLRYTPSSTAFADSGASGEYAMGDKTLITVVAVVRNNSASATFRVKLKNTIRGKTIESREVLIDNSTTNPRLVVLGQVPQIEGLLNLKVSIAASTTSGPPTLDIDYLVVASSTSPDYLNVIEFESIDLVGAFGSGSTSVSLVLNDRFVSEPHAIVSAVKVSNGDKIDTGYKSSPLIFNDSGSSVYCLLMTGGNSAAHWRFTNSSGNVITYRPVTDRHVGYQTPE